MGGNILCDNIFMIQRERRRHLETKDNNYIEIKIRQNDVTRSPCPNLSPFY